MIHPNEIVVVTAIREIEMVGSDTTFRFDIYPEGNPSPFPVMSEGWTEDGDREGSCRQAKTELVAVWNRLLDRIVRRTRNSVAERRLADG